MAVVQAAPVFLNRDDDIKKGISLIKEAAAHKADIIAFPKNVDSRLSVVDLAWFACVGDAVCPTLPRQLT